MRRCLSALAVLVLFAAGCAHRPLTEAERLGLLPLDMVAIPGGTFLMGDVVEGESEDAMPVHAVTLPDYRLGRYEVTFAQYDAFATATGRPLPPDDGHGRDDRAVVHVTWDDATAFCSLYGYRLPTETEWEFAAREGGKPLRYAGVNDPDSLHVLGRVSVEVEARSFPVGRYRPNALGLYDLSGNVMEWIGAYYQFYPEPGTEPIWHDLEALAMRIHRGGSFSQDARLARTFHRSGTLRDLSADDLGFRCAADA